MKKKKKSKLFIILIICFVLVPFLLTKGCNYMESLNQAKNSISEQITSISEQTQPVSRVYTHAHSIRKANWTGTAVPNSGYVENVYVNTTLSVEEVVEILKSVDFDYIDLFGNNSYIILVNGNGESSIQIIKVSETNFAINVILNGGETSFIAFSNEGIEGVTGWGEFENPIVFNQIVISEMEGVSFGTQNDKLSSLFSITPFEKSSNNELSIGNLFTQIGNAIIIFGGAVVNVFISMEPIFWNEGPTLIFILLIAAVSFGLVFWGIELLISLIGVFKTKRKKKK